jgi:hypothetical protein
MKGSALTARHPHDTRHWYVAAQILHSMLAVFVLESLGREVQEGVTAAAVCATAAVSIVSMAQREALLTW